MMNGTRWTLALAVFLAFASAKAAPPQRDLSSSRYDVRFAGVPLGQGYAEVYRYIHRHLYSMHEKQLNNTTDLNVRDQILAGIERNLQSIRDSLTEFKGQKTGYNVSVIASDFAHSTGESMIVVPYKNTHDYYFFVQGKLWKVVTTHVMRGTFSAFLVRLTQLYGAPDSIEFSDPEFRQNPKKARWSSNQWIVETAVHPVYGAVTLQWTSREIREGIAKIRGSVRPPGQTTSTALDPDIQDIMQD
jgi:hypothetical protein